MCASQLPQRYILPRIWKALCLPEKPIKFNHLKQFHNFMLQCSFITSKTASLLKLIALRGQSQKLNCRGDVFKTLTCSAPPISTTFSSYPNDTGQWHRARRRHQWRMWVIPIIHLLPVIRPTHYITLHVMPHPTITSDKSTFTFSAVSCKLWWLIKSAIDLQ